MRPRGAAATGLGQSDTAMSPRMTQQERKDLQWNEVFQQLHGEMRARHREGRPSLEVYTKLSHHAHDFLSAAGDDHCAFKATHHPPPTTA